MKKAIFLILLNLYFYIICSDRVALEKSTIIEIKNLEKQRIINLIRQYIENNNFTDLEKELPQYLPFFSKPEELINIEIDSNGNTLFYKVVEAKQLNLFLLLLNYDQNIYKNNNQDSPTIDLIKSDPKFKKIYNLAIKNQSAKEKLFFLFKKDDFSLDEPQPKGYSLAKLSITSCLALIIVTTGILTLTYRMTH